MMLNDLYNVLLTVYDRGGKTTTDFTTVQVSRDLKVGNFTLGFTDIDLPLAGIPITVDRVYDSRDQQQGDFGIGWRLDYQSLRMRATLDQGLGWQSTRTGVILPTYTLSPLRPVSVRGYQHLRSWRLRWPVRRSDSKTASSRASGRPV